MKTQYVAFATPLLVVIALLAAAVGINAQDLSWSVEIPTSTVVRGPVGSTHEIGNWQTPSELVGLECSIVAEAENNSSVHPGNNISIGSNDSSVTLSDVEGESGKVTHGESTLILGDKVIATLTLGKDKVFSGGLKISFTCTPPKTSTPEPSLTPTATATATETPAPVIWFDANADCEAYSLGSRNGQFEVTYQVTSENGTIELTESVTANDEAMSALTMWETPPYGKTSIVWHGIFRPNDGSLPIAVDSDEKQLICGTPTTATPTIEPSLTPTATETPEEENTPVSSPTPLPNTGMAAAVPTHYRLPDATLAIAGQSAAIFNEDNLSVQFGPEKVIRNGNTLGAHRNTINGQAAVGYLFVTAAYGEQIQITENGVTRTYQLIWNRNIDRSDFEKVVLNHTEDLLVFTCSGSYQNGLYTGYFIASYEEVH